MTSCPICSARGEQHAVGWYCTRCHAQPGYPWFHLREFPKAGLRHVDSYGRLTERDHEPVAVFWPKEATSPVERARSIFGPIAEDPQGVSVPSRLLRRKK